ncbi:MAG: response regulator transcription factor [Actinobacteria bacterium]|nr:MAG: response regulator transcription factor [Actinomycetota bacterium]
MARGAADATRVLLVDDQESFRGAVRDVIAAIPGFVLVGEAASGEEAVAAVESLSPGLVLMDVRMPGMGGAQATREIVNRYPGVVVILMSIDAAEALPDTVHACGAAAFLRKQDLRPGALRDLWEMQREAQERGALADEPGCSSRPDEPRR